MLRLVAAFVALFAVLAVGRAGAEDGYELWLRYHPLPAAVQAQDRPFLQAIVADPDAWDIKVQAAAGELERAVTGFIGKTPDSYGRILPAGSVLLGTPAGSPRIRGLGLDLAGLGDEGFVVQTSTVEGKRTIVVAANGGAGVLYGTFALIREIQLGHRLDRLDLRSAPRVRLRMLDHWDNPDRTVERGYAGPSIWNWWTLPDWRDPRYTDYARANASVGINGAVLNNVNAKALNLTPRYIAKAAALADMFRPWNVRVYLSARWTAPMELGGLKSADPLDPAVAAWWKAKADEIYRAIPDFGGFLVKANSEGEPGPGDYHRSHAEGANMLAAALAPHGGTVIWRAFVYSEHNAQDRAKQAYDDFRPLDGKFASNVIVQVKNGPIDFQPREPFHPLFGAMPKTPLAMELQLTKEYLGFATHLVYLGPLFEEVMRSDTFAHGAGSSVARVVDGSLDGHQLSAVAGVANVGSDRDWAGSTFNQANWYAFGRFAWNPDADARVVAAEWAGLTFDPAVVDRVVAIMMPSREAAVDYMTPLGLAHMMGTGHHYGPAPWVGDLARPEWNPTYYHRADADGIGFDRTATGSNAIAQYSPEIARLLGDRAHVPDKYLLWFHHVGWDERLASGETLWISLVHRYDAGVAAVDAMERRWAALASSIDAERFTKTEAFLQIQKREARWWRDACLAYFMSVSHHALPPGSPPPAHPLAWYQAQSFPDAPGH